MKAKSIEGNSPEEIRSALQQATADGFSPTLAIVFISIKQDREAVCEILKKENIDFIGATSSGEFINGHQSQGAIAIMLLDISRDHYSICFEDTHDKDLADAAKEVTDISLSKFKNPAFVLCSTCLSVKGEMYDGVTLIQSIQRNAGNDAEIFGGMAGDDGTLTGTYVFTGNQSTDEGFAVLILDNDRIRVRGVAVSGWKPLGTVRTVTKCEDGWMYSIDGKQALEMYLRYLGESLHNTDGEQKNFVEEISFYYPFLALDDGDPVLRTPMAVDREKNAIKLDFPIPEGKQLQFTMPPDFDIVETVLNHATAMKAKNDSGADALLIFSCLGRLSALGPMVQQENEGLQEIWKAPMAGFFSYGEYGKDINGKHGLHSTTCSWVALKEK